MRVNMKTSIQVSAQVSEGRGQRFHNRSQGGYRSCNAGLGLVELLIASTVGALVLGGGLRMMLATVSAENRSEHKVQVAHQVALATSWIRKDMDRMQYIPSLYPLEVSSVESGGVTYSGARVSLSMDYANFYETNLTYNVTYEFQPKMGLLKRYQEGQVTHEFILGAGSTVVFSKVERNLAFDSEIQPGTFANQLSFRITSTSGEGKDRETLTLVGARSFETKVSLESFPYWSPTLR